jgi:hypothetical protein
MSAMIIQHLFALLRAFGKRELARLNTLGPRRRPARRTGAVRGSGRRSDDEARGTIVVRHNDADGAAVRGGAGE